MTDTWEELAQDQIRNRELTPFQVPGGAGFSTNPTGNPPQVQTLPPFQIPGMNDAALLRSLGGAILPRATLPRGLGLPRGPAPAGMASNLPPLYDPKKIPLPTAPTAPKESAWQEARLPLMALAMLASAFTRQPAVAAMNAMAGMMKGEREGNQEAYQNSRAQYQDELTKALNEQKQELEEYQASYRNRALSWSERMAEMRATAVKRGHNTMLTTLDSGKDPGSLLDQYGRAGVALTPVKEKAAFIKDEMGKDTNLTYGQAETKWLQEQDRRKQEARGEKPLTVTQEKAKAIEELMQRNAGNPNYSRAEAIKEVEARNNRSGLTGNKAADIQQRDAIATEALDKVDATLDILNKYRMAAGLAGKGFRGIEIVGNITGADAETDRVQMRRNLKDLMLLYPRILGGGRPLAMDAKHMEDVIGGLGAGDTTLNTIRSLEELRNTIMRFKQTNQSILRSPGAAPQNSGAPAPSQEIDWNAFPKAE